MLNSQEAYFHAHKINLLLNIAEVLDFNISPENAEELLPHYDARCESGMDFATSFCFAFEDWKGAKHDSFMEVS